MDCFYGQQPWFLDHLERKGGEKKMKVDGVMTPEVITEDEDVSVTVISRSSWAL